MCVQADAGHHHRWRSSSSRILQSRKHCIHPRRQCSHRRRPPCQPRFRLRTMTRILMRRRRFHCRRPRISRYCRSSSTTTLRARQHRVTPSCIRLDSYGQVQSVSACKIKTHRRTLIRMVSLPSKAPCQFHIHHCRTGAINLCTLVRLSTHVGQQCTYVRALRPQCRCACKQTREIITAGKTPMVAGRRLAFPAAFYRTGNTASIPIIHVPVVAHLRASHDSVSAHSITL